MEYDTAARLKVALEEVRTSRALLHKWAAIVKGLNLTERSGEIADYDDELAGEVADTAKATLAWRANVNGGLY